MTPGINPGPASAICASGSSLGPPCVRAKAGPNSLFESVATKTPYFAISHISGQEDGNLDIIKDYKLGFVEERSAKAVKLLKQTCNNPETLKQFDKSLETLAKYNKNSGKRLIELIESMNN